MSWLKTFEDCACGFLVYSETKVFLDVSRVLLLATTRNLARASTIGTVPPASEGPAEGLNQVTPFKVLQYWLNSFARYLQCAARSLWVVTLNPLVNCHHCPCWSCDFGRSPIFRHTHIVFYGSLCWNHQQKTRSSSEWASGCRSDLKPSPILPSTCGLYFFPKR